jgi:hypothetical protein
MSPDAQAFRSVASTILLDKEPSWPYRRRLGRRVAMANQTTAVERIEARVQGEVSGQIAVGKHILQIGSVHGGIVNVAVPGEQPRPKARSLPIQLRPRPFPGILNRTEESAAATRSLECGQSAEFFGESGLGKTVLLRHLAHKIDSTHFREGVIYREIHDDPPGDALQMLWSDFFECDSPFKPTDSQLRSDLQSKQALIILDAVELSRAEVEQVMNVAATCTFLLGSPERHLWGDDAHTTHLGGLPVKDAKTLVERELGRLLAEDEALAVEKITNALKGNPLRILQQVAMARLDDRSLTRVAQDLQLDGSSEKSAVSITVPLSDVHRRMLSALAIFSGASVRATTLGELLQVDDAEAILEELEERHLVRAAQGGYKLVGEATPFTPKDREADEERKRAIAYFADWIERHRRDVKTILATLPVLMCCLRWGVKFAMAAEVMRITKSLEFTLVLNARWESWANTLRLAAQSAIDAKDKAALGWVRHQNGTKALCDGNLPEARESFEQALQIREALGDKAGADVTRHNLNFVAPPTIPAWKVWTFPAGIAIAACTFIAAIVFGSKVPNLWRPSQTRAPRATAASASLASSPTIPPPTGPAPIGHPQRQTPSNVQPVIPPLTGAPAPGPVQSGMPPFFPPLEFVRPIDGWIFWYPVWRHKNHHPQKPPGNGDTPPPRQGGTSDGTTAQSPPKTPETPQSPGKKKKGSEHDGTSSRNPDRSGGISSEPQPGTHKRLKRGGAPSGGPSAGVGGGQGKAGNANKKVETGSPSAGPHVGVSPSSMGVDPSVPRYWPPSPYTRYPALKRPMGRRTPPPIR